MMSDKIKSRFSCMQLLTMILTVGVTFLSGWLTPSIVWAGDAGEQKKYRAIDIGIPDGCSQIFPRSMNKKGQVGFQCQRVGVTTNRVYRHDPRGKAGDDLGAVGNKKIADVFGAAVAGSSLGGSINNSGMITGQLNNQAFRKEHGPAAAELLGLLMDDTNSFGYAINDSGVVVGASNRTGPPFRGRAFIKEPGVAIADLGHLGMMAPTTTSPGAINSLNHVVGGSGNDAFLKVPGSVMEVIPRAALASATSMLAYDINDEGVISGAGNVRVEGIGSVTHSFVKFLGLELQLLPEPTPLGTLRATRPFAISNRNVVVGERMNHVEGRFVSNAFIWRASQPGEVKDLNTLSTPIEGFTLYSAKDITDRGEILVAAREIMRVRTIAVVLTPRTGSTAQTRAGESGEFLPENCTIPRTISYETLGPDGRMVATSVPFTDGASQQQKFNSIRLAAFNADPDADQSRTTMSEGVKAVDSEETVTLARVHVDYRVDEWNDTLRRTAITDVNSSVGLTTDGNNVPEWAADILATFTLDGGQDEGLPMNVGIASFGFSAGLFLCRCQ